MNSLHLAAAVLLGSALCPTHAQQFGKASPQEVTKSRLPVALKVASPSSGTTTLPVVGPSNDACANPITVVGNGPHPWNNVGATTDFGPEFCTTGGPNQDVWYTWNATGTGLATISLCTPAVNDTVIAVYNGAGCPTQGTAIECDDDSCFTGFDESVGQFAATGGVDYTIRIGGFGAFTGSGSFTFTVSTPPANDDCGSPDLIAGVGAFPFDNTLGTTGAEGQAEPLCFFFSSTTIDNDIWYTWTAPSTDTFRLNTCGLTSVDTKIAVYDGAGCPTSAAIACNDDACPGFQTTLTFNGIANNLYTIQLGTFPGASGGIGSFEIDVPPPPGPCDVYHDGTTDQGIGLTNGGEVAWLHKQGLPGSTTVTAISTAWGDPIFGSGISNGDPAKVAIWDDPNDDGNPNDCVLLQLVNTTVANVDTNILNTVPLAPSVTVNGVYFIGAGIVHAPNEFPAPEDTSSPSGGRAWIVGNSSGTMDYNNLAANDIPPLDPDTIPGLAGVWLLEADCFGAAITPTCFGDGTGPACPCGNSGAAGRGCDNSIAGVGGGLLSGTGTPSLANDQLTMTATNLRPSSLSVLWQSTLQDSGSVFGDGVACLDGVLKRLFTGTASGGVRNYSGISAASSARGDTIGAGETRLYHTFYRDPDPVFCPAATFNTTNGVSVLWSN